MSAFEVFFSFYGLILVRIRRVSGAMLTLLIVLYGIAAIWSPAT